MITFIVFVSVMLVYVSVVFFRGIYREKKERKLKKYEEDLLGDEENY